MNSDGPVASEEKIAGISGIFEKAVSGTLFFTILSHDGRFHQKVALPMLRRCRPSAPRGMKTTRLP
jgi:hypothetical protein